MNIREIFRSRQGEGRMTGVESVFVRASGCHLRCVYCDTAYAFAPEGSEDLTVPEVVERVVQLGGGQPGESPEALRHVVLTGGEPMLQAELVPLSEKLVELGFHVTVETAGTDFQPVACQLMSISPKLSNAFGPRGRRPSCAATDDEVLRRLIAQYDYQIKLVVDRPEDLDEVAAFLDARPHLDRRRVLLMPQGTTVEELSERAEWLEPYCRRQGLAFCPRKQIEWYGPRPGR